MAEAVDSGIRADTIATDAPEEVFEEKHWTEKPPGLLEQLALRWFGNVARKRLPNHPDLGVKLLKADIATVPVAYLATAYLRAALVFGFSFFIWLLYFALVGTAGDIRLTLALFFAGGLFAVMIYSYTLFAPDLTIRNRKRNIEDNLPYALNFMAAMSGAGVVPVEVWGALATQPVYGDVAKEASEIYRDTKVFSKDIVTAMKDAARRSPSQAFEEFLMGSVNTVASGGDLRMYYLSRSQFLTEENRRKQKSFLESLGVMAESYVVVGAAAPLFILVIISIMVLVNSSGADVTGILNLLVLLGMPVIHGMFAYIIGTMRAE